MFSFFSGRGWRQQTQQQQESSSFFNTSGPSSSNNLRGTGDDGDNSSSHGQSANSHGTEGTTTTTTTTTVKRRSPLGLGQLGGGPSSGVGSVSSSRDFSISPPIPRAVPASLMGLNSPTEARPMPRFGGSGRSTPAGDDATLPSTSNVLSLTGAPTTPLTSRIPTKKSDDPSISSSISAASRPGQSGASGAWIEEAAARRQARRNLEAGTGSGAAGVGAPGAVGATAGSSVSNATSGFHRPSARPDSRSGFYPPPPPEVVRLDSDDPSNDDFIHDGDDDHHVDNHHPHHHDENTPRQFTAYPNRDSAGSANTDEVVEHMYASYAHHLQQLHQQHQQQQHHHPSSVSSTRTSLEGGEGYGGSPFDSDSSEDVHSQSFPFPPATFPTLPPSQHGQGKSGRWQAPKLQIQIVHPIQQPPNNPGTTTEAASSSNRQYQTPPHSNNSHSTSSSSSSLTTIGPSSGNNAHNSHSNDPSSYAYAYSTPTSSNPNLVAQPNTNNNINTNINTNNNQLAAPYYPLAAKQLSPIVEQDYISPTSAKSRRSSSSMNGSRFFFPPGPNERGGASGMRSRKGSLISSTAPTASNTGTPVLPSPATTTGSSSVFRLANVGGIKAPGAHLGGIGGGGGMGDWGEGGSEMGTNSSVTGTVTGSVVSGGSASGGSGSASGSGGGKAARTSSSLGSMKGLVAAAGTSVPAVPSVPSPLPTPAKEQQPPPAPPPPPPIPQQYQQKPGDGTATSSKEFPVLSGGVVYTDPSPVAGPDSAGVPRPSPVYASPFINRPLNRTHSQNSSISSVHRNSHLTSPGGGAGPSRQSTASSTATGPASLPGSRSNTMDSLGGVLTPTSGGSGTGTGSISMFTATSGSASTVVQSPTSPLGASAAASGGSPPSGVQIGIAYLPPVSPPPPHVPPTPTLPPLVPAASSHVHGHGHGHGGRGPPPVAGSHAQAPIVIRPPPPPPQAHLAPAPTSVPVPTATPGVPLAPGSPYVLLVNRPGAAATGPGGTLRNPKGQHGPGSGTKRRPVSHGHLGSSNGRRRPLSEGAGVDKMPVIEGSVDDGHVRAGSGYYEGFDGHGDHEVEIEDDEEHGVADEEEYGSEDDEYDEDDDEEEVYEMESMRDSFVTAGTGPGMGGHPGASTSALSVQPGVGGVPMLTISTTAGGPKTKISAVDLAGAASGSKENERKPGELDGADIEAGAGGPTLSNPASQTGESFITRRWDRSAALFSSPLVSPIKLRTKRQHRVWPIVGSGDSGGLVTRLAALTPAFWVFWIGFLFPVLWLIGGWHFTNCGEMPPKYTFWEWYFWNQRWTWEGFKRRVRMSCFGSGGQDDGAGEIEARMTGGEGFRHHLPFHHHHDRDRDRQIPPAEPVGAGMPHRRKGSLRPSASQRSMRIGKVYPAVPRWVAERQPTDDGRARLNDMKRSLKGISFGYPFVPRMPGSLASFEAAGGGGGRGGRLGKRVRAVLCAPNRVLDQLYGVKIMEVRGRPESGRRMIDPWIQRCRYALCYGLLVVAIGLCVGCAYLIARNTRQL